MRETVKQLDSFYSTKCGFAARMMVMRRLQALWPDLAGRDVLGYGYAPPYLEPFRGRARRTIAGHGRHLRALGWQPFIVMKDLKVIEPRPGQNRAAEQDNRDDLAAHAACPPASVCTKASAHSLANARTRPIYDCRSVTEITPRASSRLKIWLALIH